MNEVSITSDQVPDFMKSEKAGMGAEGLSNSALTPPRLKLAQAVSPEIDSIMDLKPGQFFNSVGEIVYGNKLSIVPCYLAESYLLFAPRIAGASSGGLLARANNGVSWDPPNQEFEVVINKRGDKVKWRTADTVGKSGLANWGTSDPSDPKSPPAATWSLNCVTLLPDFLDDGPSVLSFMRSGAKIGKKFAGNLKMSRVPTFGRMFELSSVKVGEGGDAYYEPRIKAIGFITNPKVYNMGKEIYEMAKDRGVQVDVGEEAHLDSPARSARSAAGIDDDVLF